MSTYQKVFGNFEHGFIGYCTIGILVSSCLGSIAAMAILLNGTAVVEMFQLFIVVASCMMFNGSVLSQQKPKIVFNLLIWSLSVSSILTIFNVL